MHADRSALTRHPFRDLCQCALLPLLRRYCHLAVRAEAGHDLAALPAPCIFAANHHSHLDSLAVLAALPGATRARTRVAAAEDYWFRSPGRSAAATLCNAFPFPRQGAAGLDRSSALLGAGWSVVLYPAGTREGGRGFRRGVGCLATRTGAPVIPTAILGSAAIWPKGRRFPRRGEVTVVFGAPLAFGSWVAPDEATGLIEAAVQHLAADEGGDV